MAHGGAQGDVKDRASSVWWRSGWYWLLTATVTAASAAAVFVRAPLSWDGSLYLLQIYDRRAPFVPLDRWGVLLQQWPAVLFSRTGDFAATRAAFIVAYALTPAVLLAVASAFVWSDRRRLLPLLVVGMLTSTCVSQSFFVAESVTAVQYWWCAWAAFAVRDGSRLKKVAGCAFAALACFTYLPACLLVGVLAITLRRRDGGASRIWVEVLVASLLARAVVLALRGGVPQTETSNAQASVGQMLAPLGWMLVVGFLLVVLGLCLLHWSRLPPGLAGGVGLAGLVLLVAALVVDDHLGLQERVALWGLVLPVALVGCVVLVLPPKPVPVGVIVPAIVGAWLFAMALSLGGWSRYLTEVEDQLSVSSGCSIGVTTIRGRIHWSMTTLSLVLEGPGADRILIGYGTCEDWEAGDPLLSSDPTGPRAGGGGQFVFPTLP